jgi:hypothetical protein
MDMENSHALYNDELASHELINNVNHPYNDGSVSGAWIDNQSHPCNDGSVSGPWIDNQIHPVSDGSVSGAWIDNLNHPCNDGSVSGPWIDNPPPQVFSPRDGYVPIYSNGSESLLRCTPEQLQRFGYRRPQSNYPIESRDSQGNLLDPNPIREKKKAPQQTYTGNVTIRCLEPPILEGAETLTVEEKRPPQPPPPPPLVIRERHKPPRLADITFYEEPLPVPRILPRHEKCYFMLDAPPAPARRVIRQICEYPAEPPNIIIEKWLPYKRSRPQKLIVKPAPPFKPIKQKNCIIIYEAVPSRNIYEVICDNHIEKTTDPEDYKQRYAGQLVPRVELERRVREKLEELRVSQETINKVNHYLRNWCVVGSNPCDSIMPRLPISNFQTSTETNVTYTY